MLMKTFNMQHTLAQRFSLEIPHTLQFFADFQRHMSSNLINIKKILFVTCLPPGSIGPL